MQRLTILRKSKDKRNIGIQGFTLIEIMIVAAILVLLASIAVPMLFRSFEDARRQRLEIDAYQIQSAIDRSILQARLRGTVADIIAMEINSSVLESAYGVRLNISNGVTFRFSYSSSEAMSYVEVVYDGQTFSTRDGVWREE
jgi:prepilin-type N-terminal cleavage/methylation domain-containing protein